jgi:hypothetical protein
VPQVKQSPSDEQLEEVIYRKLSKLIDKSADNRINELRRILSIRSSVAFSESMEHVDEVTLGSIADEITKVLEMDFLGFGGEKDVSNIVISNHIGANKLVKIFPGDMSLDVSAKQDSRITQLVNNDSFLLLFSPVIKAISLLGKNKILAFIPVLMSYPEPHRTYAEKLGFVCIDSKSSGNFSGLLEKVKCRISDAKQSDKIPVVIIFPEGGTSGKRSGRDPYQLEDFKSGFYRLALELKVGVQPVLVGFKKDFRFWAKAMLPIPYKTLRAIAVSDIRRGMQCELRDALNCEI